MVTQIVEVLVNDLFVYKIKTFANGLFNINQVESYKA
jgi:hypothetical protein